MSRLLEKKRVLELTEAVGITGQLDSFYKGFSVDSREIEPGYIFAAVKGHQADGHDFISQAVEKGAEVILTERDPATLELPQGVAGIRVKDVRLALSKLSFAFEGDPQNKLSVAGVTGTNGKTTVTTLVHQVLTRLGFRAGMLGTVEKRVGDTASVTRLTTGSPQEIARDFSGMLDAGCTHVVMEVSSHGLSQRRTDAVTFDVAAFTNLSHDHLDYHGSPEAYLKAKKRLFDGLGEDHIAVINTDEEATPKLISDCRAVIWPYGLKDESMRIIRNDAEGLSVEMDGTRIDSPLCGLFNAYNLAAAFLICRAFGCSARNTAAALSEAKGARGRLERIVTEDEGLPSVFVDYAHTPDALENVLATLRNMEPEKQLIVVFGCGGNRDRDKRPEMGRIAASLADLVIVTSDNPRFEEPDAIIREIITGIPNADTLVNPDRPAAITEAVAMADENAVVLIAGKGHETYQEVMGVRYDIDDAKIARRALQLRAGREIKKGEDV